MALHFLITKPGQMYATNWEKTV